MRTFSILAVFGLLTPLCIAGPVSICDANSKNLVANCGFETGGFTSWSLAGLDVPRELNNLYGVEGIDPDGIAPNSGSFQAYFGDLVSNATTLSQTLATKPNEYYTVSWDLAQDTPLISPYSNAFSASLGGTNIARLTALGVQGYTQYSFTVAVFSTSSTLSFTLGNDLGEFLLDDVVVTDVGPTPEPATWLLMFSSGAMLCFSWRMKMKSEVRLIFYT